MPYKQHQRQLLDSICANWRLTSIKDFFDFPPTSNYCSDLSFSGNDAPATTRRMRPETEQLSTAFLKALARLSALRDVSISQVRALVSELVDGRVSTSGGGLHAITPKVLREALRYFDGHPEQGRDDSEQDENDISAPTGGSTCRVLPGFDSTLGSQNGLRRPDFEAALARIRDGMEIEPDSMYQTLWHAMQQLSQDYEKRCNDKMAAAGAVPYSELHQHLPHMDAITSGLRTPEVLCLALNPDFYLHKRKGKRRASCAGHSVDPSRQLKRRKLEMASLQASCDIAALDKEELVEEVASSAEAGDKINAELSKYIPAATWRRILQAAEQIQQAGLHGFFPSVIPLEHCRDEQLEGWEDHVHAFPENFYRFKYTLDRALVGVSRREELLVMDGKECERRTKVAEARMARKELDLQALREELADMSHEFAGRHH